MRIINKFFTIGNGKQFGFTMISLLITIVILGILAAIVVPRVIQYINHNSTTGRPTVEDSVTTAAEAEKAIVTNAVLTAMTEAKVSSIGGIGPFTVDKNNDLDAETGGKTGIYLVGKYLAGGIGWLEGAYSVTNDGTVIQTSYAPSEALSDNQEPTPSLNVPIVLPTFEIPQPAGLNPGKIIPTAIPSIPSITFP